MRKDLNSESERWGIYGPPLKCGLLTTEEICQWLTIDKEQFRYLMGRHLPTLRQMKIGQRMLWRWEDAALLYYCIGRCESERVDEARKKLPKCLPEGFQLPVKLEPVRDRLTMDHDGPSIYFLFQGGIAIYVGLSIEPKRRLAQHAAGAGATSKKTFDAYLLYPVELEEMLQAERTFIALLDPPLNKVLRNKV